MRKALLACCLLLLGSGASVAQTLPFYDQRYYDGPDCTKEIEATGSLKGDWARNVCNSLKTIEEASRKNLALRWSNIPPYAKTRCIAEIAARRQAAEQRGGAKGTEKLETYFALMQCVDSISK